MASLEARTQRALLALRLGVFIVMFMWTLDKFVVPEHAAGVFEAFYGIGGLGAGLIYVVGAVELVLAESSAPELRANRRPTKEK